MPPNDLSDLLSGPSTIPVSPPQVIVGIPADLLRRRPDIRSAELQAVAQSAQIGVAKADLGALVYRVRDLQAQRHLPLGQPAGQEPPLLAPERPRLPLHHKHRPPA